MAKIKAFQPEANFTITVAPNANTTTPVPGSGETLRIYNPTNGIVFAKMGGDATVTAGVGDFPIPPGADRLIDIGGGGVYQANGYLALFQAAAATGGSVYVSRGDGSTMQ